MACQSLDNDEILNVRWATEDPNPVQKVAEKRRLEDMGQEAIRARMDPKIVDAMRSVRALEDGDVLDEEEEEEEDEPTKRRKLEIPSEPPIPTGLLSADTLEGLKYFAEIRKRNGLVPAPVKKASPTGLLVDYGSDDE
jgi:hypothetical protein